ncbi:MAG: multidrug efflux pump subunit AcrB [Pseudohongiellaceae bacterium]|jgi:multidrug efflux pump subunit AcrB
MNGIISWMARNGVAANLLMVFMLVAGVTSFFQITVKLFPEVNLDQITIRVMYPGASPTEVEESIIRRIEEKVESVEEIQDITAIAAEGMGTVTVELVRGADTQLRMDEIKSEVDQITTFPIDAEEPQISLLSSSQRAMQVVVGGNTSERELKELANRVKDELIFKEGISIATISGARDYEISIEASNDDLRSQGLTLTDISTAVRQESLELPGGEIETPSEELVLRTLGRNYNQQDFEEIVLRSGENGGRIVLGDVATVSDGFTDTDLINLYDGIPAVMINVMRVGDEQILDIAKIVEQYLTEELQPTLPLGVFAVVGRNEASVIKGRLGLLVKNGIMGLILVVITLTIFLDFRVAAWTSLGILISFVGVFAVMRFFGTSINVLSTIGFLLAIGIVVDDAIVVGENIFARQETGIHPLRAAIEGAQRISIPVTFAVATTIATFSSLLTLPGTLGGLLGDIPMVVIGVLFLSVTEALLVLPYHLSHPSKKVKTGNRVTRSLDNLHKKVGKGFKWFVNGPLHRSLEFVTHHPWVAICSSISLLFITAGILAGGYVKFTFFPEIEGDNVIASIELPAGATVERTRVVVDRLEAEAIRLGEEYNALVETGEPAIKSLNILVGAQDSGQPSPLASAGGGESPNVATIVLELSAPETRSFAASDFEDRWREAVGLVPEARKLTYSSEQMSFGDPVRVELTAASDETLDAVVNEVEASLRQLNGVFDVKNDRDTGKREVTFSLKPEARTYGLTLQSLALQVRAAFFGDESLRVQRGREDVRVYIRLPGEERNSLDDLKAYRIKTPEGFVPLGEVAALEEGTSPTTIQRRNGRRIIAVTANVDSEIITSNEVNAYISSTLMPSVQQSYPDLTHDFGGEQREQARTGPAIVLNFFYALIAIYAMLAIAFKSYIQPLIVMATIPFGIFGAIMGHLIMGMNLSLLSIFGIIGLSGVIVNGALVMIDFINEEVKNGMDYHKAIVEGAKNRFRPIFLTSLTTFLGVAPLVFETSVEAQFMIPVALSVGFGVLFGTGILLALVPAMMSLISPPKLEAELDHSGQPAGEYYQQA